MKILSFLTLVFFSVFTISKSKAQNSVLAEGVFYKLEVTENKVYKITPDFLASLGINVSSINPNNIKVYGNGGGMLPQANKDFRYKSLQENPVYVVGGDDNSFDNSDYLLFYGQDAHKTYFDDQTNKFMREFNLYDEKNYYFLTIGNSESKKIIDNENINQGASNTITYFDDFIYHEIDEYNSLESGRMWFEDTYSKGIDKFHFKLPGILSNSQILLDITVMSKSFSQSNFEISVNQLNLESLDVLATINSAYGITGRLASKSYAVNSSVLFNIDLDLGIKYIRPGNSSNDIGYLDFFNLNFQRQLKLYGDYTIFSTIETKDYDISEFLVSDVSNNIKIWDITNPIEVKNQLFNLNNRLVTFSTYTKHDNNTITTFITFKPENTTSPKFSGVVENQNIHGLITPELLIITPKKLITEAERLATFRRNNDNLTVEVVTTEQVYNEFSSGKQDITAIRDLAKRMYLKDSKFKYLLLFGDASYDYKKRIDTKTNQIPTYESRESLHNINSFSSDDYFGYLDQHEGYWEENSSNDNTLTLDIGIGRLPVNTLKQANELVNKLIHYSSNINSLGEWRNKIVFVADDGNGNTHQNQADELGNIIESTEAYHRYNVNRLFIDAFPQESTAKGKISPIIKEKLDSFGKKGILILNYTGHGSEIQWTSEAILTSTQVNNWNNIDNMPLLVTATCAFGRYDGRLFSGAEAAILNPNGGAIGLLTTSRSVYSSQNRKVNVAFYNNVFPENNSKTLRLGDIIKKTKDESISGISNRNFTLLGDPSMQLAYPKENIVINEINNNELTINEPLTLKALDEITVSGEIQNGGLFSENFEGVLYITVFEKMAEFYTYGDQGGKDEDNIVKAYNSRENIIYKGRATIQQGKFTFSFIVPKDIDYSLESGKISMYAKHKTEYRDAGGATTNILVGGSVKGNNDITPPHIAAFLNNEDFISGDIIFGNATLIINLYDDSGINILGTRPDHDISAVLDGDTKNSIVLNSYFETSYLDNYKNGIVNYPLSNLSDGKHTLKIKAWDNYNNSAKTTIEFEVTGSNQLIINNAQAYPNPSKRNQNINFKFSHNRKGESLKVQILVYNLTAQLVKTLQQTILNSDSKVDNLLWNTSNETLRQGLYFYKILVTSLTTNLTGTGTGKFFIVD